MQNIYYVYLHINELTGEPFYVGKGKNNRAFNTNRTVYWKNIVKKYNYDIIFLETNLTEENAFILEKYWIKRIGRKDNNTGTLINFTDGGEGSSNPSKELRYKIGSGMRGKKLSIERIELMRQHALGNSYGKGYIPTLEQRQIASKTHKGIAKTEEQKIKISNSHKGKILKESTKEKLSLINKGKIPINAINKAAELCRNSIWINNNINSKRINQEMLSKYLLLGWKLGMKK